MCRVRSGHTPVSINTKHSSRLLCCRTRTEARGPQPAMIKMAGRLFHPENLHFLKDFVVNTQPIDLLVFAHIYYSNNIFTYWRGCY